MDRSDPSPPLVHWDRSGLMDLLRLPPLSDRKALMDHSDPLLLWLPLGRSVPMDRLDPSDP